MRPPRQPDLHAPRPASQPPQAGSGWMQLPRSVCAAAVVGVASGCVIMDESPDKGAPGPPQADTVEWSSGEVDSGEAAQALPTVGVTWAESALEVAVSDGADWTLGLAETGGSCGGNVACWTGEDCYAGFTAEDGSAVGPYCHDVVGGTAELSYGGDLTGLEPGTTVFRPDFADTVTFLLIPGEATRASVPCLVFGDDPSYYAELGCTELVP